jgi:hypothetical protein
MRMFAMALSANYLLIRGAITNSTQRKAILVYYAGDPATTTRKLWPLVIGTTRTASGDVERVLCYQYDGYSKVLPLATPHPNLANLRCFKVESLKDPTNPTNPDPTTNLVLEIDFSPTTWTPPTVKFKQVKKQNCIEDVDEARFRPV